jgi:hypothetical protein
MAIDEYSCYGQSYPPLQEWLCGFAHPTYFGFDLPSLFVHPFSIAWLLWRTGLVRKSILWIAAFDALIWTSITLAAPRLPEHPLSPFDFLFPAIGLIMTGSFVSGWLLIFRAAGALNGEHLAESELPDRADEVDG